ncbi:hypothetical protein [Leptospira sarikeiensis]|uniref:Lipoprotein n=1 Tax=Leptospira sarikeiensis TaxID=2484943 RepID=A0A4R9KDK2_9LEPT|nr:hypothetical protein [Leptospira sarikeiensis]TGL63252.1 hypothetical protein EHQ64_04620 [Leptospira sarikeiensis]
MKLKLLVFSLLFIFSSCITIPVGVSLNDPLSQKRPLPLTAFIDRVTLPANIDSVKSKEDKLTLAIVEYSKKANYFQKTAYIGYKEPSDTKYKILTFICSSFEETRKPHPAYFPLAILTLTIYIWAGGPIASDHSQYECNLTVKNPNGNVLFKNTKRIFNVRDVNLYSKYYTFPSGIEDRTETLSSLINSYYNTIKETN